MKYSLNKDSVMMRTIEKLRSGEVTWEVVESYYIVDERIKGMIDQYLKKSK